MRATNNSLNAIHIKMVIVYLFTAIPLKVYFLKCFINFAVTKNLRGYNFINKNFIKTRYKYDTDLWYR